MRNLLLFMLLVAVFVLGSRSCGGFHFGIGGTSGKGPIQTETRSESGFTKISLDMSGDVELTQGDHFSVEVSAQQNLLPLIKTEVRDGSLRIYTEDNINSNEPITVRVIAPAIEGLYLGGSGNMEIKSALRAEKMEIAVGGSGNIMSNQSDFGSLEASVSGSGNLELGGKARNVNASVSGSGEVDATKMSADSMQASVSGSGEISANVISVLKADVSGSGNVRYSGSPSVSQSVSGSGSVERIENQ